MYKRLKGKTSVWSTHHSYYINARLLKTKKKRMQVSANLPMLKQKLISLWIFVIHKSRSSKKPAFASGRNSLVIKINNSNNYNPSHF